MDTFVGGFLLALLDGDLGAIAVISLTQLNQPGLIFMAVNKSDK